MYAAIVSFVDRCLRLIGCKTVNQQFLLSYAFIFILAAATGVSLYLSMAISPQTMDLAGRQRMLTQQLTKEALLVAAGAAQRSQLEDTLALYERSHRALMNGAPAEHINRIEQSVIIQQMQRAEQLWQPYKASLLGHIQQPSAQSLRQLQQQADELQVQLDNTIGMITRTAHKTERFQLQLAVGCIVFILMLVVLGRIFGLYTLMHNVDRLNRRMNEVGDGKFTHRFQISHTDNEVGQLYSNFNSMLDHVSDLMRQVQQTVSNTESHVGNVVAATEDAEHGVRRQYEDIELIATAMKEMTSSVQAVASNAAEAESAARNTDLQARNGGQVVTEAGSSTERMLSTLRTTEATLNGLAQATQDVGNVTSVINGIAEQTNLLALNAAIEAARAGDQGRGFAVVADEVRTLAQRTQTSTQEIQTIIEQLQKQADEAVSSMSQSTELAVHSSEMSLSAAETLSDIVISTDTISSMNSQIATASEQQSQVVLDIDQRVVNISDMASNTKHDTGKVVVATEQIRDEIQILNQLVQRFKI